MKNLIAILLILVMMFSLGCVALADVDSPTGGDEDPDNPSPQTSDLASIVWIIVAAVAAVGVAFFCGKKLIIEK